MFLKLNIPIPYDLTIPVKGSIAVCPHGHQKPCQEFSKSAIHSSFKLKMTQMSYSRIDK